MSVNGKVDREDREDRPEKAKKLKIESEDANVTEKIKESFPDRSKVLIWPLMSRQYLTRMDMLMQRHS